MDNNTFYKGYAPEDISVCFNGEFIHPFPDGFRPAKYVMQRDQYGDRCVIVKAEDKPYSSKYGKFDPYKPIMETIGDTLIPNDVFYPETFLNNSPKVPYNGPVPPTTYVPPTPPEPWLPPVYPPYKPPYVCNPIFEKCVIVVPPDKPIDPDHPAPVPLPAGFGLLCVGLVAFRLIKKRKS